MLPFKSRFKSDPNIGNLSQAEQGQASASTPGGATTVRAQAGPSNTRTQSGAFSAVRRQLPRGVPSAPVEPDPRLPPAPALPPPPLAKDDDIRADQLAEIQDYLKGIHRIANKNVTSYKLGETNYHRLGQLATPTLAKAVGLTAFTAAVYFVLTRAMLIDPGRVISDLSGRISGTIVKDVPGAVEKAMQSPLDALKAGLDQKWDARWADTSAKLMEVLEKAIKNGTLEAPPGADKVAHITEKVYDLVKPLISGEGSLAAAARADTAQAIQGMVDLNEEGVRKTIMETVRDILVNGGTQVVQSAAQYLNSPKELAKTGITGTWMFLVGALGNDVSAHWTRSSMTVMGGHRQDFYKLMADPGTHERLMNLRPSYQKQAKKMIQALESDFTNLALQEGGATDVKLDPARTRDILEWLDKIIINGPTENKPVEMWATDRKQYLMNVLREAKSFPQNQRTPVEFGCFGHAARSVFPPHVGGSLRINLRGLPGMGKTHTVNIIKEQTQGLSSKVTLEPVQMGEGGVADFNAKGWDAVDAVKFKTSYTQLLGNVMKGRLLSDRNTVGYENGALNHISHFEEFPFDNPEAQAFLKPFLDPSQKWFELRSLNVHAYTGGGTYIFDSNAQNVTSTRSEFAHDDGAVTSRFQVTQHYGRVDEHTQRSAIDKEHEAALTIYSTPFTAKIAGAEGPFPSILDASDLSEVRETFDQVKESLLEQHNKSFANLRVPYAQVLTELIVFNILKRKLLTSDERRELDVKLLEVDDFKAEIESYYKPFIKARQDAVGVTEVVSGSEPTQPSDGVRRRKARSIEEDY